MGGRGLELKEGRVREWDGEGGSKEISIKKKLYAAKL